MVAKDFDKPEPSDPRNKAGWEAERDLAFFLTREYGPKPAIRVFNDLRFADVSGGFSQIDHLIPTATASPSSKAKASPESWKSIASTEQPRPPGRERRMTAHDRETGRSQSRFATL